MVESWWCDTFLLRTRSDGYDDDDGVAKRRNFKA